MRSDMRQVGLRELKNHLSRYVRQVRAGHEIQVTDRGEMVAELLPPRAESSAILGWLLGEPRGSDRLCKQTGRTRSELVRDALRRQLILLRFERLRRRALPFAEARGYLTDEDVARDVS